MGSLALNAPVIWDRRVNDRIRIICDALACNARIQANLPGLQSLLRDDLDDNIKVEKQDFHRRLLQVFRDSEADNTYQEMLGHFTDEEQEKIEQFVAGEDISEISRGFSAGFSLGVREHIEALFNAKCVRISAEGPVSVHGLSTERVVDSSDENNSAWGQFVDAIFELFRDTSVERDSVLVYENAHFQNWGKLVDYVPTYTCVPSSVAGIQRIVKYAKEHDMGVRCAGFRHSWAPIFGRKGQILISLLDLHEASRLPNITALPFPQTASKELETIELVDGIPRKAGNALVRVGVSTTNERLRRWCIKNGKYTLPLNVIMVETTIGGTNGPICHGAGRRNKTLSDLVRKIQYVDCNGEVRTVNNPEHLRAAAGCFGLIGVITHITFEFSPMTYAIMKPKKLPVVRAVPPPDDIEIPPALRVPGLTPEDKAHDIAEFERQAANDYYCEWFWFPYSDHAWVNCWNDTTDPTGVIDYPDDAAIFLQFIAQFTANVIQDAQILQELITAANLDEVAVTLQSRAGMLSMPHEPVKTYLTDALHFQRGIQNTRVLDLEVEMPLLPKKGAPDGTPDFDLTRRAWWDAILTCYKYSATTPMRMPLEMRMMGGSDMIMAPQSGNRLGTCAIEVITTRPMNNLGWKPFAQDVLDKWMSLRDDEGRPLRTRPHWAKQWDGFTVQGVAWQKKMKEDYKDEIREFKTTLAAIGAEHGGWTLEDLKQRFSNDFFDDFYFDDV